jgi:hypothetical protein
MTKIAFLSMLCALSAGCASQAPTQVKPMEATPATGAVRMEMKLE